PEPREVKTRVLECTQPDYAKWDQVESGMSEADLRKLLGDPIAVETASFRLLTFGRLRFDSPALPGSYDFVVVIDKLTGKVLGKQDPFAGRLSESGKPRHPTLTGPDVIVQPEPDPRFLDLRWNPSAGQYPMRYLVAIDMGIPHYS